MHPTSIRSRSTRCANSIGFPRGTLGWCLADFYATHGFAVPGSEMARGSRTTGDFAWVDHLELAPLPLADVPARFGVEPPPRPDDGHHIYW